jgi:predicted MFS family arabinose efflux permease
MANAMGRLLGTVLSGWVFQMAGLEACLWISSAMLLLTAFISLWLPRVNTARDVMNDSRPPKRKRSP